MILPEISILKLLCTKDTYNEVRPKLTVSDFPKELQSILRVLDAHFRIDDSIDLSVDDLSNLVFSTNPRDREFTLGVLDAIRGNDASADSSRKLVQALQRSRRLREVSLLAYDVAEGRGGFDDVLTKFKELEVLDGRTTESADDDLEEFVSSDLRQLIERRRTIPGLRWRLNTLNKVFGPLRTGDFGFIFARPETGKTTLLASEVTFMAEQAKGPILWLNNEEAGDKVMMRCYQASLGIDQIELYRNAEENWKKFIELTGDRIKMIDRGSIDKGFVEKLCEKHKPSLLLFDQIDKIKGFDNDREDLRLGSIYIWARELAKEYCPTIGICQADGSGEGQRWLTMANVANAKTSKQAEADWILGVGAIHDSGYESIRYLHASKNKLDGDEQSIPELRHAKVEVLIQPDIARYRDLI